MSRLFAQQFGGVPYARRIVSHHVVYERAREERWLLCQSANLGKLTMG